MDVEIGNVSIAIVDVKYEDDADPLGYSSVLRIVSAMSPSSVCSQASLVITNTPGQQPTRTT
jgi:hypothetical protein